MAHIICNIPKAGNEIDGHLFVPVTFNDRLYERVSEDLDEEVASRLLQISGFELFRGPSEAVNEAIDQWQKHNVEKVVSGDVQKSREIEELQRSCSALSAELHSANRKIVERDEEIARLKGLIGEPSPKWTRDQLAAYAESIGLVVNEASSKSDIIDQIEARLEKKG